MVVKFDLGFRLGVFLLNDWFRLMGLEPVVGFINFNYWQRENPSGILELLLCFIVNNFFMFCVMIFPVLLLDEHPWHALDVFVSHLFVFGFNLSFWVYIQMQVY